MFLANYGAWRLEDNLIKYKIKKNITSTQTKDIQTRNSQTQAMLQFQSRMFVFKKQNETIFQIITTLANANHNHL